MSALSDVGNAVFRDISVAGDVRDDAQWRALLGQGRKRRRIKHTPGGHPHNQQDHAGDGVPDVPNPLDKLKLGKLAPAGFRVRSSRKLKTDYADVGIAEVDSPDGPQVRVGVIGNESGKWDAGFTGEARKAQLREEIARKQALMDSDSDDVDADIEDQISELESELEDLDNERTAVVTPEAMADLRRQLGEALVLAKANKAKQDATSDALETLDEQRDDVIAEFSDADLEQKISKAAGFVRSLQDTVKRLENGPNPRHWSPELIAELLEDRKADLAEHEAELAPLLARRAELMPPDARARLEDLDRQYAALNEADIDDMLTSAEVSAPNGTRIRAEIWGSDDEDEGWTNSRLYVLGPGETRDDANTDDAYGSFRGLKGLNKLIAGLESGDQPKSSRRDTQAKHGSHNQDDHGNRGVDLIPPMAGLPVLDDEAYEKEYGTVLDERSISQADGIDLQVRVFELGDAHIVLDLPGNRHQVMSDFDDTDGMRALAGDIRSMRDTELPDSEPAGGLIADADSHRHDYYTGVDDLGNIWLRTSDQAEDDYLELSDVEADDLADALDDMADTLDEEFGDSVEIVGGKSLRKHGTHDQRTHGRRRTAAVLDVPDVPAPKPVAEPKPPKPRRAPKPKPPRDAASSTPAPRPRGRRAEPKPDDAPRYQPPATLTKQEQDRAARLTRKDPQIFATAHDRFGPISTSGMLDDEDAKWLQAVYEREPAFVNHVAQTARIEENLRRAARNAGLTPAEFNQAASDRLREVFAGKPVAVRTNEKALRDILADGRFKTQFEGVKRNGALKAGVERRRMAEQMMGVAPDADPARRPVYGYLAPNGVEAAGEAGDTGDDLLSTYGRVQVVLKPDVRSRTTATVRDSLDWIFGVQPSPIDNPTALSAAPGYNWTLDDLDEIQKPDFRASSYVETQIHGGVGVGDIAEVVFPTQPDPATVAALNGKGISWRIL